MSASSDHQATEDANGHHALMGMARSLTPEEVHYYLLDFGNGGFSH